MEFGFHSVRHALSRAISFGRCCYLFVQIQIQSNKHQAVKFDFTADLTGTRNRSEEVIMFIDDSHNDAGLEVSDTCVRNFLLS